MPCLLRELGFVKPPDFDCQRCGACCCNRQENMDQHFYDYVEVKKSDAMFKRKDLMKKLVVRNEEGEFHLRLVGEEQRCIALLGRLGSQVRCDVYALRPAGCRRVEVGSHACLEARRDRGID